MAGVFRAWRSTIIVHHIAGSVLTDHDLSQKIQQVVLDKWTRNRGTGFVPYGYGLR